MNNSMNDEQYEDLYSEALLCLGQIVEVGEPFLQPDRTRVCKVGEQFERSAGLRALVGKNNCGPHQTVAWKGPFDPPRPHLGFLSRKAPHTHDRPDLCDDVTQPRLGGDRSRRLVCLLASHRQLQSLRRAVPVLTRCRHFQFGKGVDSLCVAHVGAMVARNILICGPADPLEFNPDRVGTFKSS